jgi:hypothetical protein
MEFTNFAKLWINPDKFLLSPCGREFYRWLE